MSFLVEGCSPRPYFVFHVWVPLSRAWVFDIWSLSITFLDFGVSCCFDLGTGFFCVFLIKACSPRPYLVFHVWVPLSRAWAFDL